MPLARTRKSAKVGRRERIETSTIDDQTGCLVQSSWADSMGSDTLSVSMGAKARKRRRYAIRAVIFQEGEWLCAQCLEYDLVAQAKSLPQLFRALERLIVGHIAVRLRHKQQPFRDLPRAPRKYWTLFRRSRLALPAPTFRVGALRSHGVIVAAPEVRIAALDAA